MWNGGILDISEGQFATGRKQIAEDTGLKESTIEDILNYLEKQQQIRQHKTTKFRLITIIKWKEYQHDNTKSDNKATTKQQQSDTNNKGKKEKNDKKDPTPETGGDEIGAFIKLFGGINPSYGELFKRKPQREAAARLLKQHPLLWWEQFMAGYVSVLEDRFCPRAISPAQMEDKLGAIMAYGRQRKAEGLKTKNKIWV